MSFDETLAERLRERLADDPAVTSRKMFGGLAFLVGGRMAVAAVSRGGLMVRVAHEETDALAAEQKASDSTKSAMAASGE